MSTGLLDRTGPRTRAAVVLVLYIAAALVLFGVPVLAHPGRSFVGTGADPQIFIWALGWWPHAVLHLDNPIVTHAVWAPTGADLAWATSIPGLALLLTPVTLAAGPVVAYNVAEVILPALAAWTAYLLCRHVTGRELASAGGGWLFGFSTYVAGHELGHLHLTSVFLLPLLALVILQFVRGELGGRGLALRAGVLFAFQFAFSTEVFFTATLALLVSLLLAVATVPEARPRLRALPKPLVGAYLLCSALVSPLLTYALFDFQSGSVNPPEGDPGDLLGFVFPTQLTRVGAGAATRLQPYLPAVPVEHGQYLGLPTIAVVGWLAWSRRRSPGTRFLVLALLAAAVASLGSWAYLHRHRVLPLPWIVVHRLPVFNNVIPLRFSAYVALGAATCVAIWAAAPRPPAWLRAAIVAAAILATLPNWTLPYWSTLPTRPSFFASDRLGACIRPNANVLVLPPPNRNDAMLWQVQSGFRFRMANGNVGPQLPDGVPHPGTAATVNDNDVPAGGAAAVVRLARAQLVDAILVAGDPHWAAVLAKAIHPHKVGGITLFPVTPLPAGC